MSTTIANADPASERSELMKGVREAAKPVGSMLRGDAEFDQERVMESLQVFADAADKLGGLVPKGSEGGEAAPAIWEDPAGFQEAIDNWRQATADAMEAQKTTLDQTGIAMKPVFGSCKGCHDNYRIEEE
ncbi:MAG: c-type cytochrome [Woeseiaceae bacterium]